MTRRNEERPKILVAGDFVIDHHIYEGQRHHFGDSEDTGIVVHRELGGAALIHKILNSIPNHASISCLAIKAPGPQKLKDISGLSGLDAHAYWRPFPKEARRDKQNWLVGEAMGFGQVPSGGQRYRWDTNIEIPKAPEVIVLSEGGMGFRDNVAMWKGLPLSSARYIVLKMSAPLAQGALWKKIAGSPKLREKLVMVVSASDLRKMHIQISEGRSWEETIENLSCELRRKNSGVAPLRACRHLVITFGTEAGLWLDFSESRETMKTAAIPRMYFIFDPARAENEYARDKEGKVFGLLSSMTASLAWHLATDGNGPINLMPAVEGGLAAMRDLWAKGHGSVTSKEKGYPADRLAKIILHSNAPEFTRLDFASFDVCASCCGQTCKTRGKSTLPAPWTLLRVALGGGTAPCYDLARRVLDYGPVALTRMPHLSIGKLFNADRGEVEMLRSLKEIILRYIDQGSGKKPLSIGVFGPPGSGKSFSVKQLSEALVGKDGWLEFNLSQFSGPADLIGAFHQIRDKCLEGGTPVAFFDEFDAKEYMWLQYLLAPMQDGRFQEGQITHPLGKCIFILAGGTSRTFETFGPPEPVKAGQNMQQDTAYQKFVLAKGPDFKSRLDAYLDVTGPNRRDELLGLRKTPPQNALCINGWSFVPDVHDMCFPLRRAFIIRSELGYKDNDRLEIDERLAQALLEATSFKHGSRSLGKILDPFKSKGKGSLQLSMLPARAILEMHTDADDFLRLCMQPTTSHSGKLASFTPKEEEKVAGIVHETYRGLGKRENWLDPEMDCSLADLGKKAEYRDEYESNYAAAKRMPGVLALIDHKLVKGKMSPTVMAEIAQRIELNLDLLAQKEHEGWMKWYIGRGWKYGSTKDKKKKLHHCLIPYHDLKEEEKNKDREQLRHYTAFAQKAGYKIVPMPPNGYRS